MEKSQKNHPFFAILLSKVRGSVFGGSEGSRFGIFRFDPTLEPTRPDLSGLSLPNHLPTTDPT